MASRGHEIWLRQGSSVAGCFTSVPGCIILSTGCTAYSVRHEFLNKIYYGFKKSLICYKGIISLRLDINIFRTEGEVSYELCLEGLKIIILEIWRGGFEMRDQALRLE